MFDRVWQSVVVWLAASSLLVSSTAAIVHTHEHARHEHANCSASTELSRTHAGCRHHQHHTVKSDSKSETPTQQTPTLPHSHDDCALCHFLLEHPLPPSFVELPLLDVIVEFRPESPPIVVESVRFALPLARGPPGCA